MHVNDSMKGITTRESVSVRVQIFWFQSAGIRFKRLVSRWKLILEMDHYNFLYEEVGTSLVFFRR